MGGVRGRWKVKQTAGQAAMGQLREDTHLHRVGWPFPASQQVSTCPVVTELCANLTAPSTEAPFLSASSSGQASLPTPPPPGIRPLPVRSSQVRGKTEDTLTNTGQGTRAAWASREPFPNLPGPPHGMLALL